MTALRWCALGAFAIQTAGQYREASIGLRVSPQGRLSEGLEPYDGKLSRTILRGEGAARPLPTRFVYEHSNN
jgi:hypothetical protein